MAVQGVKNNNSGLTKSVSLLLAIITMIVLIAGIAMPAGAANTTATTTVTATTTAPTLLPRGFIAAGFSGDIIEGPAPLAVRFTDQSTGGPDSWSWSFGDGSTGTEQNPLHTYLYPGTYSVTLTVRNPSGTMDTYFADGYITVNNPGTTTATVTPTVTTATVTATPTISDVVAAAFSGAPVTGQSPLYVDFTDTSRGSVSSWYWDFGDGTQSKLQKPPQHKYSVPGTYTVSLTVVGTGGDTSVKKLEDYITVTDLSTTVTTRTTAPVQTSAPGPVFSGQPTPAVTPVGQTGQTLEMEVIWFIITGIITTIVVVAAILYKGAGKRREEK